MTVAGPLVHVCLSHLVAPDAGPHASAFVGPIPVNAGLTVLALAAAALAALPAALARRPILAALSLGLALAWASFAVGRLDELVRTGVDALAFRLLAEGVVAAGLSFIVVRALTPASDRRAPRRRALLAVAAAIVLGLTLAHAVAASPLAGQGLAAAVTAALGAGVLLRLTGAPMTALAALPAAGPLVGFTLLRGFTPTNAALTERIYDTPVGLACVLPADWLAATFLGAALARWWVGTITMPAAQPSIDAPANAPLQ